jgi:hypothetical protein
MKPTFSACICYAIGYLSGHFSTELWPMFLAMAIAISINYLLTRLFKVHKIGT